MRKQIRWLARRGRQIDNVQGVGFIRNWLSSPYLWHISRRTISKATAIGVFCAYLPLPFQMLVAAILAIIFRANVPIAVSLVWISNPLTWLLIYIPPYLLGAYLLDYPEMSISQLTPSLILEQFGALSLGCLIFSSLLALAAYFTVHLLWRLDVFSEREARKNARRSQAKPPKRGS